MLTTVHSFRQRVGFCSGCADTRQSYIHGLPTTIRLNDHSDVSAIVPCAANSEPEIWARGHLHLGPSVDMHIASSIQ